jgi:predicted ATPase/DNA-binding NarL/FixJ family response regulator
MIAHNLPLQPTAFVGRAEELVEIICLLDDPDCRLLALVGPGGIGKTRLALEAAATFLKREDVWAINGIYFVALQPLTSSDFILSALAEAVGLQFYSGSEPWQQLIGFLRSKALLLILDNVEHLLDGIQIVSDLLTSAPNIKILTTSRETLNLQEEWLYPIKGMQFPENSQNDDFEHYDAVQLFLQSARRARPDFSVTAEQRNVLRICKQAEGMPLALEITAAWLRRLPCQEIVQQMERGLDILETPVRNVPPRHRSIRAVFEESWNLLTDSERDVFPKLSVFRGGFRPEAAEAIAGASLGILSALVDKSLLRVDDTGRYDLQELVRQYAAEQLDQSPQASQMAHDRHASYYKRFTLRQEQDIFPGDPNTARRAIEEDRANIISAWDWMVRQDQTRDIQEFACFLINSGVMSWQESETQLGPAIEHWRDKDELTLATLIVWRARCAQMLGRYEAAYKLNQEVLSISRQHDYKVLINLATFNLSEIARWLGDYAQARQFGEESALIQSSIPERRQYATFDLANLGEIAFLTGDYAEAKRLHEESLAAAQEVSELSGIVDAWNHLGKVHLVMDAFDDARRAFQSGLMAGKGCDYTSGIIAALTGLAETALRVGVYREATNHFRDTLSLVVTALDTRPHLILTAFVGLAELLMVEGKHEQAATLLQMCLSHPASQKRAKERAEVLLNQMTPERQIFTTAQINSAQLNEMVKATLDNLLLTEQMPSQRNNSHLDFLSERELEILHLISTGLSNREIAERLFLAVGTVKWYIGEIYSKLHVASRTQAVARAREMGLH